MATAGGTSGVGVPFPGAVSIETRGTAMAFPFVPAYYRLGRRRAPALAFVVHMAEGGGTVGYLSRPNPNRVSVHFVIERSGRIVQMLPLGEVSGSINPSRLRMTNDPPFTGYNGERVTYGIAPRRAVLGATWDRDPNHAIITVEVEGFARYGPNADQRVSLVRLYRFVVGELPTIRGNLAHRDFQSYKACPGKLIPWRNMSLITGGGKHGLMTSAERMRILAL